MAKWVSLLAALTLFALGTNIAEASYRTTTADLAKLCVGEVKKHGVATGYRVVKKVRRGGRGNATFWYNSIDESSGAYCEIKGSEVAGVFLKPEAWEGSDYFSPRKSEMLNPKSET